jgi:hypothetical protein
MRACEANSSRNESSPSAQQRDVAAERVAGDVRGLKARLVHGALDRIGDEGAADLAFQRRPARVPRQGRREHVVVALQRRQHQLPRPPRVGEAVQADQRRSAAAAVGRGEDGVHG